MTQNTTLQTKNAESKITLSHSQRKMLLTGGILGTALLANQAFAADINVDQGLGGATETICNTIKSVQKSLFLKMIAMVMFIAGLVMMWLKMRGGMAMAITGFLGYFLIRQSLTIAQAFGLLPSEADIPKTGSSTGATNAAAACKPD